MAPDPPVPQEGGPPPGAFFEGAQKCSFMFYFPTKLTFLKFWRRKALFSSSKGVPWTPLGPEGGEGGGLTPLGVVPPSPPLYKTNRHLIPDHEH